MPVPFEGKKRLYKPKSARDRKDAAFSSEAENLLFQEDGVSLRSDEILYEGRRDIFIYFFFLPSLFPTISERESWTFRASANYFDFDVSFTALSAR